MRRAPITVGRRARRPGFADKLSLSVCSADVFDRMTEQIDGSKLTLDCVGGGRIRVDPGTRTISVYDTCQVSVTLDDVRCLMLFG